MANSVNPDQTTPSEVSDLDVHCLLKPVVKNTKSKYKNPGAQVEIILCSCTVAIGTDKSRYRVNIFLFLGENICCGYLLEAPRQGSSTEYPQHMFFFLEIRRIYRARDKGSICVKYPNSLSKYSIIFKNLGIDTQLIWQSIQLLPSSRVKIKISRPEKLMISTLYYDYCTC